MNCCASGSRWRTAQRLWRHSQTLHLAPQVRSFNAFAAALCRWPETLELFKAMRLLLLEGDEVSRNALLKACGWEEALSLQAGEGNPMELWHGRKARRIGETRCFS